MGDDCRGRVSKPPLCGTDRCPCERNTLGGFDRWDAAHNAAKLLDRGWMALSDMTARTFADVLRTEAARANQTNHIRQSLTAEAKACNHPDGWVDSELRRLCHG
jgi:hypothetical protein